MIDGVVLPSGATRDKDDGLGGLSGSVPLGTSAQEIVTFPNYGTGTYDIVVTNRAIKYNRDGVSCTSTFTSFKLEVERDGAIVDTFDNPSVQRSAKSETFVTTYNVA